jgi:hypothetical protein
MYETCITIFLEIRANSATNLAGGYHPGETVPMAVIAMNRTTGALHPGCRHLVSAGGGGRRRRGRTFFEVIHQTEKRFRTFKLEGRFHQRTAFEDLRYGCYRELIL